MIGVVVLVAAVPISEVLRERGTLVLLDLNEIHLITHDNAVE